MSVLKLSKNTDKMEMEVQECIDSIEFGLYTLEECLRELRSFCHFELAKRVQAKYNQLKEKR